MALDKAAAAGRNHGFIVVGVEMFEDGVGGVGLIRAGRTNAKAIGMTHEYALNNRINGKNRNREIIALKNHEFPVLERNGKGLGDDSSISVKQVL